MSDPITSAGQALPRAQLQTFLEESQARLLVGFARMSAESLEAPVAYVLFTAWGRRP